ncbi:bifunctional cytidylyltransferase/SDR family oxidoreductase [Stenotrophomonas sp. BIO128-Bstrain]|jgi:2-C-methyl-D-erythritol 4-phosphate cytidylyltransferase|uniref:bifunctional cytidylyltransferase/SDR family oxidoreductase n=1 Tax=Stenotrophomonas sp. BIO128-Bstrain TaxID=3027225 RepID=UPI0024DEC917|nr:bifunctional cytidylyltransferase/SDR family oxidoreductase [Stenotrophomonas sp. BIO128-Bstrain]WIA63272.1 bifunctional cytidylyltransferase/SDR family oxidoreductase [Stenotrophomonas sp. BIO128-Bstrain]
MKQVKNVAVILAGGRGTRSGFSKPKQMMKLAGRPVLEHVARAFQTNAAIDEILIVANSDCIADIEQTVMTSRLSKVKSVISGGAERYDSSIAAINATKHYCADFNVQLIFHDAVRPLLSQKIIDDVIHALERYNAVDVVIRATDTIIMADPVTNTISSIPNRSLLRNGQTPQAFSHETIERAYNIALRDPGFVTTDDCGVVLKYLPEEKIYLVDGDTSNMKLTYEEDLHVLDKLCQLRSTLVESKEKIHFALSELKGKVLVIFGGTSGIGAEMAQVAEAYQAIAVVAGKSNGADITSVDSIRRVLDDTHAKYGHIDFIVNSAGILHRQPLIDMSPEDISSAIHVNYIGAVNVALVAFDHLRASKGQLLNFTSSSYTYGRAMYSLYSSSKAAIVNLTQALADEWHSQGVQVNCINPERTATPMRTRAFGLEPAESLLTARDVAEKSLLVLLSEHTGQIFDIKKTR